MTHSTIHAPDTFRSRASLISFRTLSTCECDDDEKFFIVFFAHAMSHQPRRRSEWMRATGGVIIASSKMKFSFSIIKLCRLLKISRNRFWCHFCTFEALWNWTRNEKIFLVN
jgi:hypothetical protein